MENISLFSKFNTSLSKDVGLNVSFGYSEPENDLGSFADGLIRSDSGSRTVYANAALDITLSSQSMFNFTGYYISQDLNLNNEFVPNGAPFLNTEYQEETYGADTNIIWEPPRHTLVIGAEISQGDLLQTIGFPALAESHPDILSWATYINDTLSMGQWAVTPGVRLDHNTVSGSFFSPSLGATFQPRTNLLFRGTVSKGFHYPPLGISEGGAFLLDPNPDLEAEEVWSYQVGTETTALPRMRVKATLFLHDLDKALTRERFGGGPPNYNDLFINSGGLQRRGVEMDLKTDALGHFFLEASGIYIDFDRPNSLGSTEVYAYNLVLSYDNPAIITIRLAGYYEDLNSADTLQSNFDDIIWNLNVSKEFSIGVNAKALFFITAHNLLDGEQYVLGDTKNPSRWLEGGIRFAF
jgi:vitamin B12 transporter